MSVYGDVAVLKTLVGTAAGTVNANRIAGIYIYVKKDGRWQIVHAQGTPMQRERTTVTPDAAVLKSYVGKYERNPGSEYIFSKEATNLTLATRLQGGQESRWKKIE